MLLSRAIAIAQCISQDEDVEGIEVVRFSLVLSSLSPYECYITSSYLRT